MAIIKPGYCQICRGGGDCLTCRAAQRAADFLHGLQPKTEEAQQLAA